LSSCADVCLILRDREPNRFEATAVRWIARYCVERPAVTLAEIDEATRAFALMRAGQPDQALERLQALCSATRPRAST